MFPRYCFWILFSVLGATLPIGLRLLLMTLGGESIHTGIRDVSLNGELLLIASAISGSTLGPLLEAILDRETTHRGAKLTVVLSNFLIIGLASVSYVAVLGLISGGNRPDEKCLTILSWSLLLVSFGVGLSGLYQSSRTR
ncbi:MAG: hypothetical protein O2816_01495 [Planctomycetota bacterium]|nr:hypothetical protein [Planctomycetota bacterium]